MRVCAHAAFLAAATAVLATTTAGAAPISGSDGIALSLSRDVAAGTLSLSWSGGVSPYLVFRSADPSAVVTAATRSGITSGSTLSLPEPGPAAVEYFLVVGVERTGALAASSSCLTAGTSARAAVAADLRDSLGNPLEGLEVTMAATAGFLGPVSATGSLYRAVLSAPPLPTGPALLTAAIEGEPIDVALAIDVAAPFDDLGGGAGGCPADGNLRVRVVDESGLALAGARVMIGPFEQAAVYRTAPEGLPGAGNTGLTGADGTLEFLDFGAALDGPQTVTAADDDRRYVTLVDADAADIVLPLPAVVPEAPAQIFTGDVTSMASTSCELFDFALVDSDLSLDNVLGFRSAGLLSDAVCYASQNGLVGTLVVPGNLYIPAQSLGPLCFGGSIAEHEYRSAPVPYGERRLTALQGRISSSSLPAGFEQIFSDPTFIFSRIGALGVTASAPGPTRADVPASVGLVANLTCTIDRAPASSDVYCLAAGDWDSAADSALPPGAGRLFVMGVRVGDSTGQTAPFNITGTTTVARTGAFAGIEYLGGAVATYTDETKPGIPPGTQDGASAILERSGAAFGGGGGALTFDDFFPIRTLSRAGRDLTLSALPGSLHPPAHLSRIAVEQEITETYSLSCLPEPETRTLRRTLWEVWAPGGVDTVRLPEPPSGWPRQEIGGELAGLVDPAATPEDDALIWSAATEHLGTHPAFDYRRLRFGDVRLHVTHSTRNRADY